MGFLDKRKNMFTEEVEDDEVKVEQIKSDVKKVSIESPSAKTTRSESEEFGREFRNFEDFSENKERSKKPVFFTDSDFDDLVKEPKREVKKEEKKREAKADYYNGKALKEESKPKETYTFKPSPIISPVYGILDKNYKKEDIVSKHDIPASTNIEELTVDSVRNKAYGSLEDELENTLFGQNSILFNDKVNQEKENEEDDYLEDDFFSELEKEVQPNIDEIKNVELEEEKDRLRELEEITMDITRELDSLINKKEKQQEAKYEPKHSDEPEEDEEDDLFDLIDSMYEGEDEL